LAEAALQLAGDALSGDTAGAVRMATAAGVGDDAAEAAAAAADTDADEGESDVLLDENQRTELRVQFERDARDSLSQAQQIQEAARARNTWGPWWLWLLLVFFGWNEIRSVALGFFFGFVFFMVLTTILWPQRVSQQPAAGAGRACAARRVVHGRGASVGAVRAGGDGNGHAAGRYGDAARHGWWRGWRPQGEARVRRIISHSPYFENRGRRELAEKIL
jgi:hypothetical protein